MCGRQANDSRPAHGSPAPSLWLEYLRSEGHEHYDGTCSCVYCDLVRGGFEGWKSKRASVQGSTEVTDAKRSVE